MNAIKVVKTLDEACKDAHKYHSFMCILYAFFGKVSIKISKNNKNIKK